MVVQPVASLDQYGRCVICGRRDGCCSDCHRGHDWVMAFPKWALHTGPGRSEDQVRRATNQPSDDFVRLVAPLWKAAYESTPR